MKKLIIFTLMLTLAIAAAAFGADPVAVTAPVAPVAAPTLLGWFNANSVLILGVALAVSELLATVPGFQGNGILDTIIKALKALSGKAQ